MQFNRTGEHHTLEAVRRLQRQRGKPGQGSPGTNVRQRFSAEFGRVVAHIRQSALTERRRQRAAGRSGDSVAIGKENQRAAGGTRAGKTENVLARQQCFNYGGAVAPDFA